MNHFTTVTVTRLQHIFRALSPAPIRKPGLLLFLLFSSLGLLAQNESRAQTPPPPLPTRQISGIVKDSTDLGVIGATVTLTSAKDTLKTSTNSDGIFIFKNVKSATYTILVQSIGYAASKPMRFKQNDAVPRIIMDPIVLKEEKNVLNEVVISGTPSITYKTDTVEYKASDYIVRKNATVDELLKKMEGMQVNNDGTLVHQGQNVTKAKLNGKEYLGGDIANAIKNLPAEIVDKIQVVDDYGDQAARTGIKDGDPEKVLNITTRVDKSVGNLANINAGIGNDKRYETGLFATRVNGNQTFGLNARFNNTVNGVAPSGDNGGNTGGGGRGNGGGGNTGGAQSASGGTTRTGIGSFSYRDKLSKKVEMNLNYAYGSTDVNSLNKSDSRNVSSLGTLLSSRNSIGDNLNRNHTFRLELEANLDSNNYLKVTPTIKYTSGSTSKIDSLRQTDLFHQDQFSNGTSKNTRPQFGVTAFYQHIFKKPRRNISIQLDANSNNQDAEQRQNTRIIYYLDATETIAKDSLVNRIIARKNLQDNYRGSLTYVEPLTVNTQFEVNAQVNYNGYNNTATTSNINANGNQSTIDSLSNIYDYSFTQARIALNYRYGLSNLSKVRFSIGLTAIPAVLSGTKVSLGTTINRSSFNVIPIARFEYLWSRQHKIQLNYSGNAVEPTFDQIQPVRDVTNPQNPIVGNPNLQASFNHSINANYNNYIANSKLNYSINLNTTLTDNAVIRNIVQIKDPVGGSKNSLINETRYLNMDGVYNFNMNYSINKQLNNRKYNLAFSGSLNYDHRPSMVNDLKNITSVWTFIERVGPRINPTEWFEINPSVSFNRTQAYNSPLFQANNSKTNTVALNVDGRVYFWETYLFGYSASKNYVSGISSNVTSNPLVINMYAEKELFNRRAKVTLQAFDILNQNNFVNRTIVDNTTTDTKTNALSRYFMLRFSMRLQKWSGAQGRNGRPVMRRGDGSFM